jgi:1-acyl-sn-glycerol-3-phosphate acyltransferase
MFIIFFLILFPLFLIFGILRFKKGIWYIVKFWSVAWLGVIGMRTIKIYDGITPNILHSNKGYIVVANHQSYMDVPLIFRTLPFMTRTLAKIELAKVPLFGYLYKQMTVLVDRSNPVSKRKSMMDLKKIIKNGESIFIFPEGTFNETNKTFLPFYDGAFKIAIDTKTDILPILFLDTADRFGYTSVWDWSPGKNRVVFLPPINIEKYHGGEHKALKQEVFNQMSNAMHKYKSKLELVLI